MAVAERESLPVSWASCRTIPVTLSHHKVPAADASGHHELPICDTPDHHETFVHDSERSHRTTPSEVELAGDRYHEEPLPRTVASSMATPITQDRREACFMISRVIKMAA